MNDFLQAENVSKQYSGQTVLDDVTLRLEPGSATALMGPSGGGKTTLLRLLAGLETPDSGQIKGVEGLRFCWVFQEDRLCESFDALANVRLVLPRARQPQAADMLAAVGLEEEDRNKPVANLSGGQRRRVALVRAVEAEGDVLVLDEAFKGLDRAVRAEVFQYIRERRAGRTLLLVTHDREEAEAFEAEVVWIGERGQEPYTE